MQLDPTFVMALSRRFGSLNATLGVSLVGQGRARVESVVPHGFFLQVTATTGEIGEPAEIGVSLAIDTRSGDVTGSFCEADGGADCRHVVAALVEYALGPRAEPAQPVPPWRRALDDLVPGPDAADTSEVALMLSVVEPTTTRDSWAYHRRRGQFLGIRPAVRGTRGRWIKGQADWQRIEDLGLEPLHRRLLQQLRGLHAVGDGDSYYYAPEWLPLDEFSGRGLSALLAELRESGVELVSPGKDQSTVQVGAGARARVAVEHHRKRVRVRGELLVDDALVDARSVFLVGVPGVAVAQVTDPGGAGEQVVLHPLADPIEPAAWQLLRRKDAISVDEKGREQFESEYLPRLWALGPVESPDGSYDVPPLPQLGLDLAVTQVDDQVTLSWEWDGAIPGVPRDRAREREVLARVRDAVGDHGEAVGTTAGAAPPDRVLTGPAAVRVVAEVLPRLREVDGVRVTRDEAVPDYRPAVATPVVSIAPTAAGNDWFDLQVQVELDGAPVEFGRLFAALAAGDELFVMPDGTYFPLAGTEFDQLRTIIAESRTLTDRTRDGIRISRYQVDLWQELLELGIVEAQAQAWLSAARGLSDAEALEPVAVPDGVHAELRTYQREGLAWLHFLRTHRLGGILGDDMGLGKTLQTIAMIARAREDEPGAPPFVVVAPTSVVGNWRRECERFAPGLRVVTIDATERRRGAPLAEVVAGADVVVTSYTLFRLEEEGYQGLPWSGLILDEAQLIKNHRSRGYRAAKVLDVPFKLAITGTPLENNLLELWALTALTCPGLFGSETHFGELYRSPIEKDGDAARLAQLQRRLRPFLLRRRKEDVATELPPKQEQVLELELHPKHRKVYELRLQRERQKVLGLLEDADAHRFQVFRSLTLLRQLALDAELVDDGTDEAGGFSASGAPPSAKLEALVEILSEAAAEGHRVLVFSQFTRFLAKARGLAEEAGIATAYLDGGTRRREAEIERFRGGDAPVFFVSLKAGGFGLNLTEADYVVLLDPWWNPATEAQAIDRTHRIGQDKPVMVYRLVAADTIEAKVLALSARKAKLFSDVLDGDGSGSAGALTADEIRDLVS